MIPILLAEEQGMVRGALAALLAFEPDLEIVAQASSGDEVLAAARRTHPDAALLDIEMSGSDGLEATAQLKHELPDCTIVIVTTFGRRAYLRRAMAAGASGFLVKDAPAERLANAIRSTAAGERVIDPELAVAALQQRRRPAHRARAGRARRRSERHTDLRDGVAPAPRAAGSDTRRSAK